MGVNTSIPRGTRDFSPVEMVRRNYIFQQIKDVFKLYGFVPIETPAFENLSTLTGKYGDEGDQLLYKILNSRIHESKEKDRLTKEFALSLEKARNTEILTERALRYDLTVPFARYVVMHRNEIMFPFKRYQVQPVWRADKPQKGRYREFYQCDVDVIGSDSLLNEVEIIQIIDQVFRNLGVEVTIKFNNRKILNGIAEVIGEADKIIDITVAIDKLDKIGYEGVKKELAGKGISELAIEKLGPVINSSNAGYNEKISLLKNTLQNSEIGLKGIAEIETVFNYLQNLSITSDVELDIALARGLNYYTGAIFEVKAKKVDIGSICGGGRYDDLTGIFGLQGVSGVGVSFGADRVYDVMNELNLFPENTFETTRVLFVNFGKEEEKYSLNVLSQVRKAGINAEIFPESAKIKKQMAYADHRKIPFVVLIGADEMNTGIITLRDMKTGEQKKLPATELISYIKQ